MSQRGMAVAITGTLTRLAVMMLYALPILISRAVAPGALRRGALGVLPRPKRVIPVVVSTVA